MIYGHIKQSQYVLKKWTIQVNYTARNDKGKPFRARSVFQCEAYTLPGAYKLAEEADWGGYEPVTFGACLIGWHSRIK